MSKIAMLTGIATKYNASALLATTGALNFGDVAQAASRPYCVLTEVSSSAEQTSSSWDDKTLLQFTLVSKSKSALEVMGLYEQLIALFDNAAISVTSGNVVSFTRQGEVLLRDPDGDGWQYSVDYRAHLVRQKI